MAERIRSIYDRWGAALLAAAALVVMLCTLYGGETVAE